MSFSAAFKRAAFSLLTLSTRTSLALGPPPVGLGSAANYVILAQTGVSTVPSSIIDGDVGLSPAAGSFLTGFALTKDPTNQFATSSQVNGSLFAADYTTPTPSMLDTSVSNMQTAYTDASTRLNPDFLNLGAGDLSGLTLTPGLYKWTSGVTSPTSITISGTALDTWIFQISGTLTLASNIRVILSGGALAQNIVWAIADSVAIGSGAHFEGILLGKTSVTLETGATMNGRLLSQTAVALQQATVNAPLNVITPPANPPMTSTITSTTTLTTTSTTPATSTTIPVSQCNTGDVQCCKSVEKASSASVLLLLLGIVLQNLSVVVGITCTPISAIGIGSNTCTAQPVCCTNNSFNGLIAIGCTPINLSL